METTNRNTTTGWIFGLIGGLVMVLLTLVQYLNGVAAFVDLRYAFGYLVIIAIAIVAGLRQKKLNGGYLSASEGLKVIFTVFALGFLLQTIFSHFLLNYIDVPFGDAVIQAGIEKQVAFMKRMEASQSDIDEIVKRGNDPRNKSILGVLFNYCLVCLPFFVISLIIAVIIRRKRPPFENSL